MKRTQQINHAYFRKRWHVYRITPAMLAISAVFVLTSCEKKDDNVLLYMNSDNQANTSSVLNKQHNPVDNTDTQQKNAKIAPIYTSRTACVAKFGENQCIQAAPTQTNTTKIQHNSDIWIPLITGYMMGQIIDNSKYAQQSLSPSGVANNPSSNQFTKNNEHLTIISPKTTTAPKLATTQTITRGGFGETVIKQRLLQNSITNKQYRTMGS